MAVYRDRPVRPGEPKPPKPKFPVGPKLPAPGKPRPKPSAPSKPRPYKPRPNPSNSRADALALLASVNTEENTKSPAERAGKSQAWKNKAQSTMRAYRPEPRRGYSSRQPSTRRGMR